jgi:D-glycero-beta-D-manno-heptose-7-phosphate kinase
LTVERTLLQERLISIVRRFGDRRILVIGDLIADQSVYGAIDRVSREAPVFILRHEHTETLPGGAANSAMNLASLGAAVSLIGIRGDDEAGYAVADKLNRAGVDTTGLLASNTLRTTTKVRILAGQIHSTRQQVIRIDYEGNHLTDTAVREKLREAVLEHAQAVDAVIVSDYNYGVADVEMAAFTRDVAAARKIPLLADSRFRLSSFAGFTSATPNEDEVEQLLRKQIADVAELESAAEELREQLGYRALLVTRGGQGMMLLEEGVPSIHIEAVGSHEPVDVTGAGDTVIAAYALALASDSSFPDAARLANYAGGLVIMKRGTASITREELETSVLHSQLS